MKFIILILSVIGIIVASIWMYQSGFAPEPITVLIAGVIGLLYTIRDFTKNGSPDEPQNVFPSVNQSQVTTFSPTFNINQETPSQKNQSETSIDSQTLKKNDIIEIMKPKMKILFVDDDPGFNIVKILKESGWANTSTMKDLKSIDISQVKHAHVLFIDNHGVGKLLNCESEGLDLVKMIKEKYPEKVVVIYSGDTQGNMFHEAIGLANYRLIKNALPYEFQKIIENTSIEIYHNKKNN